MASKRKITRVKPLFGNRRSHSMKATRHKFKPNLQKKRIYIPEEKRWVSVRLTTRELRTIDKIGFLNFCKRNGINVRRL